MIGARTQRKAIQLREFLGADRYQHDTENDYASVLFEGKNVEVGDFILPDEYDFVELKDTDSGTLLRTEV